MRSMKFEVFGQLRTFLILLFATHAFSRPPPNIIYILADDLGWNDVSYHGSLQIPTPNIDTLAYDGLILNNYYVQPICTPSRGTLMTGKYPIRTGLQHFVIGVSEPWGLPPEEILLPQYLKQLGYVTHGIGKWHLGFFEKEYIPTNRGFDSFLGYWSGRENYFTHFDSEGDESGLDFHDNTVDAWNYVGYYSTDIFTERAKKIIYDHDSSKPLFLYVAEQAVHSGSSKSPQQAPPKYVDKFSYIKDEKRKVFAGMGSALDKSVGEIFSALDEKNMLENSIIVFSSDNGAAVEDVEGSTGSNWPLRGSKFTLWEGGVKGAAFIWSPLLPSSRGSVFSNLMHISDWLPTLYAAAGGDPQNLGSIDGFNFWPSIISNSSSPREHILHNIDPVWQTESIRRGPYKLVKGTIYNGSLDFWFDKEGKKRENTPFSPEELHIQYELYERLLEESEVRQILNRKNVKSPDFDKRNKSQEIDHCERFSVSKIVEFVSPLKVNCGEIPPYASFNCQPLKEYCLFNIENDPCEYLNLAGVLPDVVQELKVLLDIYRMQEVPVRNKPKDPLSNPKYHGYAWVPWRSPVK